jgi:hypothetical protein
MHAQMVEVLNSIPYKPSEWTGNRSPDVIKDFKQRNLQDVTLLRMAGFQADWKKLETKLLAGELNNSTIVADLMTHDIKWHAKELLGDDYSAVELWLARLRRLLEMLRRHDVKLIWFTNMSYNMASLNDSTTSVPQQYRAQQEDTYILETLKRGLSLIERYGYPWLDQFHMTQSCRPHRDPKTGISYPCNPKAHSSQFVDLIKIDMIMNFACRCRPQMNEEHLAAKHDVLLEKWINKQPKPSQYR